MVRCVRCVEGIEGGEVCVGVMCVERGGRG